MITIQHHPTWTKKRKWHLMSSQLKKAHLQGNYTFIENATVLPFGSCDIPTEKEIVQSMWNQVQKNSTQTYPTDFILK